MNCYQCNRPECDACDLSGLFQNEEFLTEMKAAIRAKKKHCCLSIGDVWQAVRMLACHVDSLESIGATARNNEWEIISALKDRVAAIEDARRREAEYALQPFLRPVPGPPGPGTLPSVMGTYVPAELLEQARREHATAQKERDDVHKVLAELETEFGNKVQELEIAERENLRLDASGKALAEELDKANARVLELEGQLGRLEVIVKSGYEDRNVSIRHLQEELSRAKRVGAELHDLKNHLAQRESYLKTKVEELDETKFKYEKALEDARRATQGLNESWEANRAMRIELVSTQKDAKELLKQIEEFKRERDTFQHGLEMATKSIEEERAKSKRLEAQLEAAKKDREGEPGRLDRRLQDLERATDEQLGAFNEIKKIVDNFAENDDY